MSQGSGIPNKDISLKTYQSGSDQDSENLKHLQDVKQQGGGHSQQVGMQNRVHIGRHFGGFLQY